MYTKESKNLIEELKEAIKEVTEDGYLVSKIDAAVFGIAGPVDELKGEVPYLPDIP